MSNEVTVLTGLECTKSNLRVSIPAVTVRVDMAGSREYGNVQDIGFAAHEALVFGADFGTAGYFYFKNLDATNFVQIGVDVAATFYPVIKLLAGQGGLFPLAVKTLYAKADTGSVSLQYRGVEA